MFSMSCPCFQWIDVNLLKWDWKVKTQKSAFLRALRVIRDSDNTHAKNFTHPKGSFRIGGLNKCNKKPASANTHCVLTEAGLDTTYL